MDFNEFFLRKLGLNIMKYSNTSSEKIERIWRIEQTSRIEHILNDIENAHPINIRIFSYTCG